MDRLFPRYHFRPPANWINDPNGLIQWQGMYHLFYQHNPNAAVWGDMHWGHASSPDLLHWQHLPIALAPTPGGLDDYGVWSGCAVNWNGIPTVLYTAHDGKKETVCLATGSPDLLAWEKHAANPVISGPPPGQEWLGFRDPYVWHDGRSWWMVMGSGIDQVGGAVLLYSSPNLTDWSYHGPILIGDSRQVDPVWAGEMWECPNFFPLGETWLLMISAMDHHPPRSLYTLASTGRFDNGRFYPDGWAKMDGGDLSFYAPQVFRDEAGRRIVFGWAREARTIPAQEAAGWAGVMTLPRLVEIGPDGSLRQRPAPEVEALRGQSRSLENLRLEPGQLLPLDGIAGDTLELELTIRQAAGANFSLLALRSPGGEEQVEIHCDLPAGQLWVDTRRASLSPHAEPGLYEVPLALDETGALTLRVFLDRSILEVFANQRSVITTRAYPTREDSTGLALLAQGGPLTVDSIHAWPMRPVNEA